LCKVDTFFTAQPLREQEKYEFILGREDVFINLSISMNTDMIYYRRGVSTIFDFLGLLGGLQGFMMAFAQIVLSIFNWIVPLNPILEFIAPKIFWTSTKRSHPSKIERVRTLERLQLKQVFLFCCCRK
jgi:hypothetical protein